MNNKIKTYKSWKDFKNGNEKCLPYRSESSNHSKQYKTEGICKGICNRLMKGDLWNSGSFGKFIIVFDDEGNDPSHYGWKIFFS